MRNGVKKTSFCLFLPKQLVRYEYASVLNHHLPLHAHEGDQIQIVLRRKTVAVKGVAKFELDGCVANTSSCPNNILSSVAKVEANIASSTRTSKLETVVNRSFGVVRFNDARIGTARCVDRLSF